MPFADSGVIASADHCSTDSEDNWYNASWLDLSHGEMIRLGAFGSCQCYAKNPDEWWLADGCGQFNVFEVVNDNNDYQNSDVFSNNLFAYHVILAFWFKCLSFHQSRRFVLGCLPLRDKSITIFTSSVFSAIRASG